MLFIQEFKAFLEDLLVAYGAFEKLQQRLIGLLLGSDYRFTHETRDCLIGLQLGLGLGLVNCACHLPLLRRSLNLARS